MVSPAADFFLAAFEVPEVETASTDTVGHAEKLAKLSLANCDAFSTPSSSLHNSDERLLPRHRAQGRPQDLESNEMAQFQAPGANDLGGFCFFKKKEREREKSN